MKKRISLAVMALCILFLSKSLGVKAAASPVSISVNTFYSGQVTSNENRKQYHFSLSAPGKVNITFNHPNISNTGNCWKIKVINQSEEVLLEMYSSGIETTKTGGDVGLSAGQYYLQIESWSSDANSVAYNFKVNHTAASNWEAESNDGYGTADSIALNTDYYGANQFGNDKDYYKFSLSNAGAVKINFQHEILEDNNTYWYADIYNEATEHLLQLQVKGTDSSVSSAELGLAPGDYYVVISTNYFNDKTYCFNVNYQVSNYWESEANGGYGTADNITVNTGYSGANQFGNDRDYYKFSLNAAGKISVSFSHPVLNDTNVYWQLHVYNEQAEELMNLDVRGTEQNVATAELGLPAGNYYFLINTSYFSSSTYTFKVSYTQSNTWETEKNDGYDTADAITVGTPYYGACQRGNDVDYYKFVWNQKKDMEINFKHPNLNNTNRYWTVYLYNSTAEEIMSFDVSGTNTNVTSPMISLDAGTYYVGVKSANFSTATYTITINYGKPLETPALTGSIDSGRWVKLTWGKNNRANGYEIYRSSGNANNFSELKKIYDKSINTYTDTGVDQGKTYYYKVRSYLDYGQGKTYSPYSATVKVTVAANQPQNKNTPAKAVIKKVAAGSRKATIVWKKQSGVTGYQIYMSTKKSSGYKKIKTVTKASTTKYIKKGLTKRRGIILRSGLIGKCLERIFMAVSVHRNR